MQKRRASGESILAGPLLPPRNSDLNRNHNLNPPGLITIKPELRNCRLRVAVTPCHRRVRATPPPHFFQSRDNAPCQRATGASPAPFCDGASQPPNPFPTPSFGFSVTKFHIPTPPFLLPRSENQIPTPEAHFSRTESHFPAPKFHFPVPPFHWGEPAWAAVLPSSRLTINNLHK